MANAHSNSNNCSPNIHGKLSSLNNSPNSSTNIDHVLYLSYLHIVLATIMYSLTKSHRHAPKSETSTAALDSRETVENEETACRCGQGAAKTSVGKTFCHTYNSRCNCYRAFEPCLSCGCRSCYNPYGARKENIPAEFLPAPRKRRKQSTQE